MRTVLTAAAGALVGVVIGATVGRAPVAWAQQQSATNYLHINECEIPAGATVSQAIKQASDNVASFRRTGEYKSVRLFMHSYGPRLSIYTISEPKSWQSIPTGFEKFLAANPTFMTSPVTCASHSDNIVTEVNVP